MSREIKFRAWVKRKNKLIYLKGFRYSGNEKIKITFADEDKDDCTYTFLNKDVVLEQFTGLHDKNGVEIYDGDIVKEKYSKNTSYGIVQKENDTTNLEVLWKYEKKYEGEMLQLENHLSLRKVSGYEVIGNIHERSEDNDK